ncbi:MAG: hypothetical protein ACE5JL_19390, partial [Dehalococcoidia bacterium]
KSKPCSDEDCTIRYFVTRWGTPEGFYAFFSDEDGDRDINVMTLSAIATIRPGRSRVVCR